MMLPKESATFSSCRFNCFMAFLIPNSRYYLDNGYREREQLRYWSQQSNSGASNCQINIQYQYSSPLTTSYWFTHGGNTLWMQWQTSGGRVQTYVYDRIDRAPW